MLRDKNRKLRKNNPLKITRLFFIFLIILAIAIVCYFLFAKLNLYQKINSIEKIKRIVERGGVFSFLIFIILQILQTTILQIPAIFTTIAGALVFGEWTAFFLSFISVMIGSIIMFVIGRKAGRKFLNWMVGEEKADSWVEKMSNGKYLFFLMMVFPLFPDDILCVVAGLTDMSFKFFFWTNFLARGIGIASTVFFGSGAIIPFSGWGLIVWAAIGIFILTLFYLSIKFKDKIDDIGKQMFKKKNNIKFN